MNKISMNQILYDETLINGGGKANKKEGWKKLQKIISGGGGPAINLLIFNFCLSPFPVSPTITTPCMIFLKEDYFVHTFTSL